MPPTTKKVQVAKGQKKRQRLGQLDVMTEKDLLKIVPGGIAHAFVVSRLHDKQLAIAGLGPEPEWEGDMPELPADIATEDHDTLSNLLAAFTNAYSTAVWYASMASIEASLYDDILEYLKALVMREAKGTSKEKRDAEVITDDRVVAAKALARIAHSDYIRFRETANRLKAKGATVSRIGGFLGDEAATESLRADKKSTRGKSKSDRNTSSLGSERRKPRK